MNPKEIETCIRDIAQRARAASLEIATLPAATKNQFLPATGRRPHRPQTDTILEANALDVKAAGENGLCPMTERLTFTPERIAKMAEGVRQVAALPDPVGEEIERMAPPRGFDLHKTRPMGVIGIIYEPRERHRRLCHPLPQVRQCLHPSRR